MKKYFFFLTLPLWFFAPLVVQAELQCWTPPYTTSLSVQNATQCASETGGVLYDTSANIWVTPSTCTICTDATTCQQVQSPRPSTPQPAPSNPTSPANSNAFCAGGTCTYTPLEPLPGLPQTFGGKDSFARIAGGSIKLFIWLGAIVAVVMIILGALTYMFSDIVPNKKRAIERIRGAMWGLLLLAASWLILNTINPQLTNFNLNINPIAQVQNTSTSAALSNTAPPTNDQITQCQNQTNTTQVCTIQNTQCECFPNI